jgi:hypothetical protein
MGARPGGDPVRTPGPVTISIAAFGMLPQGTMVPRGGARAGDRVVVTGTIGDAALGLLRRRDPDRAKRWRLDERQHDHLIERYLLPQPRNAIAEALRQHASAAMDVSDGLAADLGKLCAASGAAADIDVARVPLSDAAHQAVASDPPLIETALTGGDDYEVSPGAGGGPPRLGGRGESRRRQAHRDRRDPRRSKHGAFSRSSRQAARVQEGLVHPFLKCHPRVGNPWTPRLQQLPPAWQQ